MLDKLDGTFEKTDNMDHKKVTNGNWIVRTV